LHYKNKKLSNKKGAKMIQTKSVNLYFGLVLICLVFIVFCASTVWAQSYYTYKTKDLKDAEVSAEQAKQIVVDMHKIMGKFSSPNKPLDIKQITEVAKEFNLYDLPVFNPYLAQDNGDMAFFAQKPPQQRSARMIVSLFAAMQLVINAADEAKGSIGNKGDLAFHSQSLAAKLLMDYNRKYPPQ
jgi:hypothetical protein